MGEESKAKVLVFSFPIQGHINPLLQFSKRLISKNVTVTFLTTSSTHNTIIRRAVAGGATALPLSFVPLDDGFEEGHPSTDSSPEYFAKFEQNVSRSLSQLISSMEPKPNAVVYDSCSPWILDVCREYPGVAAASFFTQCSTVNAIYVHFLRGEFKEFQDDVVFPAMPPLKGRDLPVFLYDNNLCRPLFELISSQFANVDHIDFFLVNSFDELEVEVLEWMKKQWPVKNIGPMIPSMYLDKRLADDKDYGISLFNAQVNKCLDWLDSKPPGSVMYVSFGSLAVLKDDQMKEVAAGLKQTGHKFLWVVRETETQKLPSSYIEDIGEKGLIVSWSPQLQVLAHKSIGCFMTHCGWNSTLEALSLGVSLIGMPAYSDQPTNAKFIEDVWKVGVRVKADKDGFVTKEEIVRCVGEVMDETSEKGKEIRKNALRLMEFAKEALSQGGNSDKNIDEFVAKIASTNWILANTKPCPRCNRQIEKNMGCNHMTCSAPCSFQFCWLCLRAYPCPGDCHLFRVGDEATSKREMAKIEFDRYMHCYERWANNQSSRLKAMGDLEKLQSVQLKELSDKQGTPETQLQFTVEAWLQIIECRRVLKWTYAYGYYLPKHEHAKKQLFEYLQGEAEVGLERLHHCAEVEFKQFLNKAQGPSKSFDDFRKKLTDLTKVTKTYFDNLVKALENGLADVALNANK